jgi:hypothetical protein
VKVELKEEGEEVSPEPVEEPSQVGQRLFQRLKYKVLILLVQFLACGYYVCIYYSSMSLQTAKYFRSLFGRLDVGILLGSP